MPSPCTGHSADPPRPITMRVDAPEGEEVTVYSASVGVRRVKPEPPPDRYVDEYGAPVKPGRVYTVTGGIEGPQSPGRIIRDGELSTEAAFFSATVAPFIAFLILGADFQFALAAGFCGFLAYSALLLSTPVFRVVFRFLGATFDRWVSLLEKAGRRFAEKLERILAGKE